MSAPTAPARAPARVRTVAVLGGGHGALATAGDLALRGLEVRLAVRNRERFAEVFATRRVRLEGALEGVGELAAVTDDHAAAVRGADLVLVPLPAHAQAEMARRIAPALVPGQPVCLMAGTFGAWVVGEELRRAGVQAPVAEMATLPYGTRVAGPATARLALVARHLPTGVYPASATEGVVALLREAYPAVEPVEDALAAGLLNFDGALHAPLVLMNAGAIERRPTFDVHVEGATPAVVAVSLALDEERIALRRALGYESHHWPLRDYYERREMFYGVRGFEDTRRRSVWNERLDFAHRYVREDIACGLALWSSLGRRLGVPTPLADAFLALAGVVTGRDLRETGRTLERLGLAGVPLDVLRSWLREGRPA